jgi:hypothetical protein
MSKNILISLLRQGNTGAEILQILDSFTVGDGPQQPTLNPVEF